MPLGVQDSQREFDVLLGAGRCMTSIIRLGWDLVACSTLILLVLGEKLPQGPHRLPALPTLLIGLALLAQSTWSWRRRRRAILQTLRDQQ